jgi:hypothetical protein
MNLEEMEIYDYARQASQPPTFAVAALESHISSGVNFY